MRLERLTVRERVRRLVQREGRLSPPWRSLYTEKKITVWCVVERRVGGGEVEMSAEAAAAEPEVADNRSAKTGNFSVLAAPQKQARAARPGAPQAPQAARSAAAGGGQQVREIKRHFRLRGFATNIEIRYKTT